MTTAKDDRGQPFRLKGQPIPEHLTHGRKTVARRRYGCECSVCLPSGQPRMAKLTGKHGPKTKAKQHGCDCHLCLPSGRRCPPKGQGLTPAQTQAALRARKQGQPVPDHVKHGRYAYRTYACRCEVCRASVSRARKSKGLAMVAAVKDDGLAVLHWPPVGDGDWTCPDCGATMRMRRQVSAAA
jgi:hypothetical protein